MAGCRPHNPQQGHTAPQLLSALSTPRRGCGEAGRDGISGSLLIQPRVAPSALADGSTLLSSLPLCPPLLDLIGHSRVPAVLLPLVSAVQSLWPCLECSTPPHPPPPGPLYHFLQEVFPGPLFPAGVVQAYGVMHSLIGLSLLIGPTHQGQCLSIGEH
jgi:hypothetical protein